MAELIELKHYSNRMEAEADRFLFESHGIMALVTSDSETGLAPHSTLVNRVKLLINDDDVEQVTELLSHQKK